jgi:predicted O-methyltransferase YrrM
MIKIWRFNPRYIIARIRNYLYFKNNQDLPWMTKEANKFLINNLSYDMTVLEFGSGRSTQFYAKRVKKVYSREHHKEWFEIVTNQIKNFANIDYKFYDNLGKYANTDDIEDNSLDLVIVDGRNRVNCLLNSISKLKMGGVLVLDNAERYMIYPTLSPAKYIRDDRNPKWIEVEEIIKAKFWRYDTTDNVSDTLFFFKRV